MRSQKVEPVAVQGSTRPCLARLISSHTPVGTRFSLLLAPPFVAFHYLRAASSEMTLTILYSSPLNPSQCHHVPCN
jgi:hypothetical protein